MKKARKARRYDAWVRHVRVKARKAWRRDGTYVAKARKARNLANSIWWYEQALIRLGQYVLFCFVFFFFNSKKKRKKRKEQEKENKNKRSKKTFLKLIYCILFIYLSIYLYTYFYSLTFSILWFWLFAVFPVTFLGHHTYIIQYIKPTRRIKIWFN